MNKPTQHLKFAVLASDSAAMVFERGELKIRLIRVNRPPYFKNHWGLPGGLLKPSETAEEAALRHLWVKGGLKMPYLEQLYTFSRVNRDPRGRVVAVAYLGLGHTSTIRENKKVEKEHEAKWWGLKELPRLAYDHEEVIGAAVRRLRAKLKYTNIAQALLPEEFTLTDLQTLYEKVLGAKLDRRNFRKKFMALGLITSSGKSLRGAANRPASLWRFKSRRLQPVEIMQ